MTDHRDGGDKTPLHQAAVTGSTAVVEDLISLGADPDVQTRRGRTALHYASENGHKDVVSLLLRVGAKVDLPNKWGRTALHYAASKHRLDCVQVLINDGAVDPKKRDIDSQTPLYHAVAASTRWRHEEVKVRETVLFLISCGDCVDIPDKSGITPLHLAAELGRIEICVLLLDEGRARVNALDQHCATPLHYAAYQGHSHIVKLLLLKGACSSIQDNAGFTAKNYLRTKKLQRDPNRETQSTRTPLSESMRKICNARKENAMHDDDGKITDLNYVKGSDKATINKRIEVSHQLSKPEDDVSLRLLQINETEGLGRVKRTPEVERIEQDIRSYIECTLLGMAWAQPRLNAILLKAGSTAENTKVGEPDEIDYMCCLTDLSKVSYTHTSPNDPPGYLKIRVQRQGLETWKDFVDEEGFLLAEKLHLQFHSMFDRHSENSDLKAMSSCLHKMRDYSGGSEVGVTVDMSQTKPGSRLYFVWRGCQFKRLIVTVDLIPAVEILGWPDSAIVLPQQGSDRYHVIPKVSPSILNKPSAGLYWRISTSMAEKRLFGAMDAPALACYTICKSLIHCLDPQRLFSDCTCSASQDFEQLSFILKHLGLYDEVVNSYLLKMIYFRERAKCRESSDWSWSAVGTRVLQILNKLITELEEERVPSYFLRDYNVLSIESSFDS